MSSNYSQKGDLITITAATGGVTNDAIARLDEIAGVYVDSATGGDLVPVAVEGVFTVTKAAAAGTAISVGEKIYATTGATATPATGASNLPLGVAVETAATGDTTCVVKLCTF